MMMMLHFRRRAGVCGLFGECISVLVLVCGKDAPSSVELNPFFSKLSLSPLEGLPTSRDAGDYTS